MALLAALPLLAQQSAITSQKNLPDTVYFSFEKTDSHTGDTTYLHSLSQTTIRRYFNKNLRGLYHDDTPVLGSVIINFNVDKEGKFTGACYEDSPTNNKSTFGGYSFYEPATGKPDSGELIIEVLRVTNNLNRLPLSPTIVAGKRLASNVRLQVIFRMDVDSSPPDSPGVITVNLYEVMH